MGKHLFHTLLGILLLAGGAVVSGGEASSREYSGPTEFRTLARENPPASALREACDALRYGPAAAVEAVSFPSRVRILNGFRNPSLPAFRPRIALRSASLGQCRISYDAEAAPLPKPLRYYVYALERIRI